MDFLGHKIDDKMIMEDHSCSSEEAECEEVGEYFEDSYYNMYHENSNEKWICDTCEREFQTSWQFQKHMSEHRTCSIDGCTFTAHEKIIEKHIQMQHCSGLYDKIRNIVTPEDIARWIAERKKKYPSKENVEKRYKQQEEMLKRGEKLKRSANRFDKNNRTRFSLKGRNYTHKRLHNKGFPRRRAAQCQQRNKPTSLIDDKSDWNGTLFPFRGTGQLYREKERENSDDFDDNEWAEGSSSRAPEKLVLKNALGALMSAYNSDDDSEIEYVIPKNEITTRKDELVAQTNLNNVEAGSLATIKIIEEKPDVHLSSDERLLEQKVERTKVPTMSDDEAPTEQKIERVEVLITNESSFEQKIQEISSVSTCKPDDNKQTRKRKRIHRKRSNNFKQKFNTSCNIDLLNTKSQSQNVECSKNIYRKRQVTLLERLLANEIIHERNVLLQCVRYIVENGFFDENNCDTKTENIV